MKQELLKLFEEMVLYINEHQSADEAWGAGHWTREGSLREIAKRITLFEFMDWLNKSE